MAGRSECWPGLTMAVGINYMDTEGRSTFRGQVTEVVSLSSTGGGSGTKYGTVSWGKGSVQ